MTHEIGPYYGLDLSEPKSRFRLVFADDVEMAIDSNSIEELEKQIEEIRKDYEEEDKELPKYKILGITEEVIVSSDS